MPRSLSHQVGILTLGRVFAYAVMFFVPIVNTRALTQEHYGYYKQFWLVFETLAPLLILGFPRSLMYYIPRSDSDRDKAVYVTQTLFYLLSMSLVAVLVYVVMGEVLGEGLGALVRAFFVRLSFFTLFMMTSQYMDQLFVAEKQVVRQAVYHAITAGLQGVVVIVISAMTGDVDKIVWGLAWFALAKFAFAIGYTTVVYRPSIRLLSFKTIGDQLSFALPVGLAGVALLLTSQTDKFIINRFLGREAFAVYTVGAIQVPFVSMIRSSISQVVFPMMSKYQKSGDYPAILDLWRRALMKTTVVFFPVFIFLEVSARQFVTIIYTEQYADAAPVFMIYLLLFLRSSVETGNIIQVFKKTMYIFKVFAVGFFVNLGLSLALFQVMGREGVPLATVITMYLVNGFNLFYASRLMNVGFFDLFPVGVLARRLVVAAVPGVALWALYRYWAVDHVVELAGAGVAYFGLYFLLARSMGYVSVDDLKAIAGKRPI